MSIRYPAAAAAIAGAAMAESIGRYPFRSASLAAQAWLVALLLIVAAPYAGIALHADRPGLTKRAFARGISLTSAAVAVLAPAVLFVMFVSIMSSWAEHPHGIERVEQVVGAIVIVPFGFILDHVPRLHLSPAKVVAFALANIWLAIIVRLSRQERDGLGDEAARDWRHGRRLGVVCGLAVPIVLMFGEMLYGRL